MHMLADWIQQIKTLFNLRSDTDELNTVASIRKNIEFRSANAWTLVFAIFIASVGLNINSVAVIIGAMLISPLMGPIVGAGLALGTFDFELLKRSLRNLSFAVGISIFTSAVYFLITPLSDVQSELLARTNPTFFDVLIAFFGGAAGIIAISRREKSNAIPGVAIATALMPPLCTAGFGLAQGELTYFFGAIYLFVINSVFICISTYLFVRYLNFAKHTATDKEKQSSLDKWIAAIASIVIIPSLVFAWFLQREVTFTSKSSQFISKEIKFDRSFVVSSNVKYSWSNPIIEINMVGDPIDESEVSLLKEKLKRYELPSEALVINQTSIADSIEKKLSERLSTDSQLAKELKIQLSQRELELNTFKLKNETSDKVSDELLAIFPNIGRLYITADKTLVYWTKPPSKQDKLKATNFLAERLKGDFSGLSLLHLQEL